MSEELYLQDLVTHLAGLKTPEKIEDFLRGILTEVELGEVATRLQIVKLLKAGMPQKEIAERLGVGIATVTRGSKEVQKGMFGDVK